MHRNSLALVLFACFALSCSNGSDAPACGSPGTYSHMEDGRCVCLPGYAWSDPNSDTDFSCVAATIQSCTPNCNGRQCGADGCGDSCGTCGTGTSCNDSAGTCEPTGQDCTPNCSGKECGPDGCRGFCGTCDDGFVCDTAAGSCNPGNCTADCTSLACGPDPVCGQSCGGCDAGSICQSGACVDSGGGDSVPVGAPCTDDSHCNGGTCITEAMGATGGYCSVLGCSSTGCPAGSDCFLLGENEVCLTTCSGDTCRSGYACYDPGACWVADGGGGGGCTPESCTDGTFCASNGECVSTPPDMPQGPVPSCSLPDWRCDGNEAYCGELIQFDPHSGTGYWDYPINGETADNQYRSYARRDLVLLIKYAAAAVDCLTKDWKFGNQGQPAALGDMSEANGAIPGTSLGEPAHPALSHTDGHDMDIGYYQVGTPDNTLRPICKHDINGEEQYHCTDTPDLIDLWRTALFIGYLHHSPQFLWVGVDGKAGPLVEDKLAALCSAGWVTGRACTNERVLYEVTDQGIGWYYFHYHHFHVGITDQNGSHPEL